jgi:signal transduction histidine kinase
MRNRSLSLRLALLAAAGSAVALIVAGIIFVSLFRDSVERNFDARLESLLDALLGAAVTEDGVEPAAADALGEPRFALPQSGWYWQIRDAATGKVTAASPSLFGDALPVTPLPPEGGAPQVMNLQGPADRQLRAMERLITTGNQDYAVLVAGDADQLASDVARFGAVVALTLAVFAVLLAFGTALLIRFGLRPLRDVRRALRRVRRGDAAQLEGRYPAEIAPLVNDLNALVASNREIVERARTHAGNLAHALKTPLAVLQNEAADADNPLARKVREQVSVMRDQVGHHLDRAQMAGQLNIIGALTEVEPVIDGLVRVMRKVHQDRGLTIDSRTDPELRFRGERQDLEEMIGNLLDNGCKWAAGRVQVTASAVGEGDTDAAAMLAVAIEDDGPGLDAEAREAALARGTRLDESRPGSGLGLSIVGELARIYRGRLTLDRSRWGGLRAQLMLPRALEQEL